MQQPLDALVRRFEQEVGRQAGEEERDGGVQTVVGVPVLDAALQRQRRRAEQGLLELLEGRFDSQQLLQPRAA